MRIAPMLAALAFTFSSASAVVIYDDGGTHDVDSPSDGIFVTNGTTVNVLPGAIIMPPVTGKGATVMNGSTLNVSGGRIEGVGTLSGNIPNPALQANHSTINISGGELIGSTAAAPGRAVQISHCDLVISGGALLGTTSWSGSQGSALGIFGTTTATISGGLFNGGLFSDGGTLIISGGEFRGRQSVLMFLGYSDLTIDVSILGGRFVSESAINPFFFGATTSPVEAKIFGGEFLSLYGGAPTWISQSFPITFTGTNLDWTQSRDLLTGTLASGDPISVILVVANPDDITLVEPVSVEPSSWGEIKSQYR